MTIVHPRNLDRASVRSLVADSLEASTTTGPSGLVQPIESLRRAHPDDLSVAICAALEALASNEVGRIETTLVQLAQLVERTPLDPLSAGARANARERAQAAGQIPLWTVARECRRQSNLAVQAYADRFAARALEAARRQEDRTWLLAMLREQGQLAFDQNKRADAVAVWSRMLELVVAPPESRARRPAAARAAHGPRRVADQRRPPRPRCPEPKPPRPQALDHSGAHWRERQIVLRSNSEPISCARDL